MEIGLAILLFVCMTALLYVILSLKITRQVDMQMKEFYKTRIHTDIQEFYREMEGYAALFENRIQRFRALVERNEEAEKRYDQAATAMAEVPVAPAVVHNKAAKAKVAAKAKATAKPAKGAAKSAPVKQSPLKQKTKTAPSRTKTPPPVFRADPPVQRVLPPQYEEPQRTARPEIADSDDTTIAEELMKDLFAQDEVKLSHATPVAKKTNTAEVVPAVETAGEKTMANFLSRLGRGTESLLFGTKTATPSPAAAPAETAKPAQATEKAPTNFGEVLRRAEQIKAEKKAERERAEVEARAEFYAAGDAFQSVKTREPAPPREEPRRNALAVKELDQHTVNFLIDSLVKDNGYRKQALRALTENNIPLTEIARLSKIDIGELELMRQLGRF